MAYKVTDHYAPEAEGVLRWNDPAMGVDWPVPASEISTNARGGAAALLADLDTPFIYGDGA